MGGKSGWEGLKGRACDTVVKNSGVLGPPARCFSFSCPLFILLIFISTEKDLVPMEILNLIHLKKRAAWQNVLSSLQICSRDAPKCEGD